MSGPLLTLEGVGYSYEGQPFALREVNVTVFPGERIAVLGSNGAGKSTFFLLCNGVLTPQGGRILYREVEITGSKADLNLLRSRVGIVFQDPNQQIIGPTVEAEISFGPLNLRLSGEEVARRVAASMAAMNLNHLAHRPPHFLSGGEKKRVSIAGVLAMEPEILLFDEPTVSLDPGNLRVLEETLLRLHSQGKTLLASTHDVDFAWRWAGRVLVFADGRLLADGAPEEIFARRELLEAAGLCRPVLWEAAELLQRRGILPQEAPLPRTPAQLDALLQHR